MSSRHEHGLGSLRQWIRLTKTERASAADCGGWRERPRSCRDLGSWAPYLSIFQRTTTKRRSLMCQRTAPGSNSERIGRMHSAPESQTPLMTSLLDQKKRSRAPVSHARLYYQLFGAACVRSVDCRRRSSLVGRPGSGPGAQGRNRTTDTVIFGHCRNGSARRSKSRTSRWMPNSRMASSRSACPSRRRCRTKCAGSRSRHNNRELARAPAWRPDAFRCHGPHTRAAPQVLGDVDELALAQAWLANDEALCQCRLLPAGRVARLVEILETLERDDRD